VAQHLGGQTKEARGATYDRKTPKKHKETMKKKIKVEEEGESRKGLEGQITTKKNCFFFTNQ
jgi:hypothetical protein